VSIALTARDAVFGIEAGDAVFGIEARGGSVGLSSIQRGSRAWDLQAIPAVQVLTAAQGHLVSSSRLAGSSLGAALRYRSHTSHERDGLRSLSISLEAAGIEASWDLDALG
jgi:hypothetical protein